MKYPQLVSARAVSAISDWLVTRLEHLGVDAPLVYSRLLLSLLHTPLQINPLDLAEISDIKICNIGRKGNRRFSSSDTDALKRVTAIESLIEAVAADQQISNIENLVDELCEKLREVEKQNSVDDSLIRDSTELETMKNSASPEDPTKRYYRAFPALSKEWSHDQTIRMTQKSLSWPSGSSTRSDNYSIGSNNTAGVKRKPKRRRNQAMSKGKYSYGRKCVSGNNSSIWDTEFEGSWEMGRDLIREFVMKQNNRNRSISESDASKFVELKDMISSKRHAANNKNSGSLLIKNMVQATNAKDNYITNFSVLDNVSNPGKSLPTTLNDTSVLIMGNNMIRDKGYATPDTLTSLSEIETSLSAAPRRLYEREVSNESINTTAATEEANHLAQFEAKFNRSVEALWDNKNVVKEDTPQIENSDSFWYNYYKHHYNTQQNDNQHLFSIKQSEEPNDRNDNQISVESFKPMLPQNLFETQNDLTNVTNINNAPKRKTRDILQSSMNFTSSIWSDNTASEDDVSFYSNIMWDPATVNENVVQVSQINIVNNENTVNDQIAATTTTNSFITGYDLPNLLKWSDCSFETPYDPTTATTQECVKSEDKIRKNLFENSYFYDYKSLPVMNNFTRNVDDNGIFPQLNTNLYEPVFEVDKQTKSMQFNNRETIKNALTNITLTNHSKFSGFIEVSPSSSAISSYNNNNLVGQADKTIPCEGPILRNEKKFPRCMQTPGTEEENLLTSERTHFRPIKQTYTDGYTFEIPSSLDEVEFTRSASGSLYLDSEKYMEYNPICSEDIDGDDGLVLKFCVKQIEKCCQTDENAVEEYISNIQEKNVNSRVISPDVDMESEMRGCYGKFNDIGNNLDMENWTMGENKQKCLNNNNSHALWEHCSACECDVISVPANRLLKDELCADGDEIMSDLKYMQNLYIGSDWEDEGDENENICQPLEPDDTTVISEKPDDIFYNVSKLISDLLKPETAKSLAQAFGKTQGNNILEEIVLNETRHPSKNSFETKNTSGNNVTANCDMDSENIQYINKNINNNDISEKYVGGLWSNDDNSIWRKEIKAPTDNICMNRGPDHTNISDKQNWEHSNLEEIWNADNEQANDFKIIEKQFRIPKRIKEDTDSFTLLNTNELSYDISNEALKRFIDVNKNINKTTNHDGHIIDARNKTNRFDRKRRHSASQNICDALDAIVGEVAGRKLTSIYNEALNVTTIITCNYWATDTAYIHEKADGTMTMNPSSILKHIPMVARPLTR